MTPNGVFVAEVCGLGERLFLWFVDTVSNDLPQGIVVNQVLVDEGFAVSDTAQVRKKSIVDHVTPFCWMKLLQHWPHHLGHVVELNAQLRRVQVGVEEVMRENPIVKPVVVVTGQKDLFLELLQPVEEHLETCLLVHFFSRIWPGCKSSGDSQPYHGEWKVRNILVLV